MTYNDPKSRNYKLVINIDRSVNQGPVARPNAEESQPGQPVSSSGPSPDPTQRRVRRVSECQAQADVQTKLS